ncbi:hypothetical protein CRM94_17280 [Burkholderia gladioli]|uniref:VWFA domain-containing protein n=1 Tax=Burkholderia gladioli TaxID=28095 RepID=A0A2A7SA73_BURGA|nr:hypothetical protein [Burkholderia gladioli]PEH40466.1 hypothetical protein CRM94_17280 [Burkholderia gladioli]
MQNGHTRYRNQLLTARILAGRCDLELLVNGNITTAMTDGKTLWYPQAWMMTDSEEMAAVMDGIIDHEAAGHGRHTDFSVPLPKQPLVKRLANIFEDVWCELEAGRKWAGIPRNLARTVDILTRWGLFGSPESIVQGGPGALMCNALLVNCRARFLPGQQGPLADQAAAAWQAAEHHFGPIWHKAWALASRSPYLRSTREATDLAVELFKLLQSEIENPEARDTRDTISDPGQSGGTVDDSRHPIDNLAVDGGDNVPGDDSSGGTDSREAADKSEGEPKPGEAGPPSGNGGEGDEPTPDARQDGTATPGAPGSSSKTGLATDSTGSVASTKQRAAVRKACDTPDTDLPPTDLGQLAGKAVSERVQQRDARSRPAWIATPVAIPATEAIPRSWHLLGTRVRNTLAGELDVYLEARVTRHTQRGYSGRRIDTSRLPRLRVGDARIFRTRREEDGLNTAISVLIDLSPSMLCTLGEVEQVMSTGATPMIDGAPKYSQYKVRRDQAAGATAVALAPILEMYDVPFEVVAYALGYQIIKSFDDSWNEVCQRSRVVSSVGNKTATGMAMTVALSRLMLRDEDRRMLVLVTDGAAGDPAVTESTYRAAKEAKVDVVTIFVGHEIRAIALMRAMLQATGFGQQFSTVNSPSELAQGVIDAIRSAF